MFASGRQYQSDLYINFTDTSSQEQITFDMSDLPEESTYVTFRGGNNISIEFYPSAFNKEEFVVGTEYQYYFSSIEPEEEEVPVSETYSFTVIEDNPGVITPTVTYSEE